jgi:hypothetical protein
MTSAWLLAHALLQAYVCTSSQASKQQAMNHSSRFLAKDRKERDFFS